MNLSKLKLFCYSWQNAGRIMRALFEVALRNGWPVMASRLLTLCKVVDKRLWGYENPLKQFPMIGPRRSGNYSDLS